MTLEAPVHSTALPSRAPNGLGDLPRLTQSSYREAVSQTVVGLAANNGNLSDQDMADLLGTSAATVGNARNRKGDLSSMPLLAIGKAFRPEALSTVMALIGAKAVPAGSVCVGDVSRIPLEIATALPLLIELLSDNDCSDTDVHALDRAGVIDMLERTTNMLTTRRNALRLRAVGD